MEPRQGAIYESKTDDDYYLPRDAHMKNGPIRCVGFSPRGNPIMERIRDGKEWIHYSGPHKFEDFFREL